MFNKLRRRFGFLFSFLSFQLVVVLLASVATAASFTLTLTNAQVSAIQYAYSVAVDRAPYATAQDWFAAQVSGGLIAQYAAAQKQAASGAFCTRFQALSQTNKDNICSSLGLANGCNPCLQ